jgi:hypothetical protein
MIFSGVAPFLAISSLLLRGQPSHFRRIEFRGEGHLDEGRYASISEMAAAERIERGYLGSLLRLTLLAPDLIEAILAGRQRGRITLPGLIEPFSTEWERQRLAFGL